ncbi:MAG: ElyC/SanA/YdcF family protein [bacterium]
MKQSNINIFKSFLAFLTVLIIFTLAIDKYISISAKDKLFYSSESIPDKKSGLLLGTGKYVYGNPNPFYENRLNAVSELWRKNKISAILISGDNSRKNYDEPSEMKEDLKKRGVPEEFINLDYAGFSTLDSIIRANKIFGIDDYIIISQAFHCERAVYIANRYGYNAIGYCAGDVKTINGFKIRIREIFARFKTFIDLYITKRNPKFLGEKQDIKYRESK